MTLDTLWPSLEMLRQKYVLIQAWKKTTNYIRYHNWYADTLGLDIRTVNLPAFIAEIEETLQHPDDWKSDPVRIVPAPKGQQRWWVSPDSGAWEPVKEVRRRIDRSSLRPLAHLSLRDQVVATAIMLCLADRVETRQGDPLNSIQHESARRRVSSYGNRLFCDESNGELSHRWGSTKLYRSYYEDYRTFVTRPSEVADSIERVSGERVFVVDSDLSQFYDRVGPELLAAKTRCFQRDSDDPKFFDLAERVFNWTWDERDESEVSAYSRAAALEDFTRIALPQGLVAAGFFANLVLVSFDEVLRSRIGEDIVPGVRLKDVCRYVDDLRIVVTISPFNRVAELQSAVVTWITRVLEEEAAGLQVSEEKTTVAEFGGSERPLVRQSSRMNRIQSAVSGGFDPLEGAEILDSIQGLMRSQDALSADRSDSAWQFSPVPDVRDETVARFSGGRFRFTYRSIRPLLDDRPTREEAQVPSTLSSDDRAGTGPRSQSELDEDARAFALGLIERWVEDPSNVRLLRIGLDIWPDPDVLQGILSLLRPYTEPGGPRGAPRRVAHYCLTEILRAGATETGLVSDAESLPSSLDLSRYREVLCQEAGRLIRPSSIKLPWYLRQQALLFHAVSDPESTPIERQGTALETQHYRRLILFRRGQLTNLHADDYATFAVLNRRAFVDDPRSVLDLSSLLASDRSTQIAVRDPAFASELAEVDNAFVSLLSARIREDLCINVSQTRGAFDSLADLILKEHENSPLRNELSLLMFSRALLEELQASNNFECLTPSQVGLRIEVKQGVAEIGSIELLRSSAEPRESIYSPPDWCSEGERWRFQLGFLLRFILTRQPDFTSIVYRSTTRVRIHEYYRPVKSHWYQRLYGLLNVQRAFGADWLPITDWMERFLLALMRWPGCRLAAGFEWVEDGIERVLQEISKRVDFLKHLRGDATGCLFLPRTAKWPTAHTGTRSLRACVVQTAIPDTVCANDLEFARRDSRRRHRFHLSAALAAVRRMLALRRTHTESDGRLDWLILPELSVHPDDVRRHLIPFARSHRTIILAGLTYEELFPGEPLVNSALWVTPEWSSQYGLQVRDFRQGKYHLAPAEKQHRLQGFRPCQWLVGFPWSQGEDDLRLTASVCYDATDLSLASDLRDRSDVFAIPSLNRDIKTFDQMALALHYHMYQLVIVANNGRYGGRNAYWPLHEQHEKQLFHLHGQPQASIAFLEIDDIADFLSRGIEKPQTLVPSKSGIWKSPPAGR